MTTLTYPVVLVNETPTPMPFNLTTFTPFRGRTINLPVVEMTAPSITPMPLTISTWRPAGAGAAAAASTPTMYWS